MTNESNSPASPDSLGDAQIRGLALLAKAKAQVAASEHARAEAFDNTFHKIKAEVSRDWWNRIWNMACAWQRCYTISNRDAGGAASGGLPLSKSRVGRVYLAGPMTGYPDFNFPAFNAAAARLRAEGFEVVNPAEHGIVDGAEWGDYLRFDLSKLSQCESIAVMPGWEKSKGARLEVHVAQALGMAVRCLYGADRSAAQGAPTPPADYPPPSDVVSKEQALEALEDLDDFSRMTVGIAPTGQHATLRRFIEQSGRERVSADPMPRPLLTDLEIQGLRRQARNDPRCADQHWFILMVRAIESYYGVTGAAAQSQPLVEPTADTKPEICYSADGETFHEELSEIFHELDNDGALVVGGTYHQGEALRRTAGHYLQDIECLFERMGEVAYDEAGEHKGDWPDNSLKPGEADELKALIRRWLDAHVKVWFYTAANVKEVAITEQDLIDYHGPQQHQVKKGEPS